MTSFLLTLSLIFTGHSLSTSSQTAKHILAGMYQQILSAEAHSYQLESFERDRDHKTRHARMKISVTDTQPLRVRAEVLYPDKGPLIEYDEEKNENEALLTPKKWLPYVNFHADIHGSLLRRGHHAINETSLHAFAKLIQRCEYDGKQSMKVKYKGVHSLNGKACHLVELSSESYHIRHYTIKAGENFIRLGFKLNVNPFKILSLNPRFSNYFEAHTGSVIRVPSAYAKRCQIYILADSHLPYRINVFDEYGLFEQYVFSDIKLDN